VFFVQYGDLTRGDDVDLALFRPHWEFVRDEAEPFDGWLGRVIGCVEELMTTRLMVQATFRGNDTDHPQKIQIFVPEPDTATSAKAAWTWRPRRWWLHDPRKPKRVQTAASTFLDTTPAPFPIRLRG
jgi:hypothetical protein